jgi:hypothetical protein
MMSETRQLRRCIPPQVVGSMLNKGYTLAICGGLGLSQIIPSGNVDEKGKVVVEFPVLVEGLHVGCTASVFIERNRD